MKPDALIYLKCTGDSFYRLWIEFLVPFHKLTPRERDVAARILMQYFKLKESISDPEVLKEVLWSAPSRKDMRESLKMTQVHFQMKLARLKESGFIVDGDINKKYIPSKSGASRFILGISFDWTSKENPSNGKEQD